jgi:hypothetical protein
MCSSLTEVPVLSFAGAYSGNDTREDSGTFPPQQQPENARVSTHCS